MARYGMVIDTLKCVGCQDCVIACEAENNVPEGFCRDWITTEAKGTFPTIQLEIRTERCNHCTDAPCVSACPTGASHYHDVGGVVLVNHIRDCKHNRRLGNQVRKSPKHRIRDVPPIELTDWHHVPACHCVGPKIVFL